MATLDEDRSQKLTRLLSYALRHGGPQLGLTGTADDGFDLDQLIAALRVRPRWTDLTQREVLDLVQGSCSSRFEVVGDRVRARYGHSLEGISPGTPGFPPALLFHTTRVIFLPAIRAHGLIANGRRYVHLTSSLDYAIALKAEHDNDNFCGAVLGVDAGRAIAARPAFFQASNLVWTASHVPPECLTLLDFNGTTSEHFQQTPIHEARITDDIFSFASALEELFGDC